MTRPLHWPALLFLGCAAAAAPDAAAQPKTDLPPPKNPVLNFALMSITDKDVKDPATGRPSKTFVVDLLEGNTYTVDLRAKAPKYVPSLRLLDETGKELAKDDNAVGGGTARLEFKPAKSGKYKVVAAATGEGVGRYHFLIDQVGGTAGPAGTGTEVALTNGVGTLSSKLIVTDPRDRVNDQSPARTFPVKMKAGKTYTIDLTGKTKTGFAFDPYLRLEDPAGKEVAKDDDGGGMLNARITYPCGKDGTYTIVATTLTKGAGFFDLKVTEK